MPSQRVNFVNAAGIQLAGILETPESDLVATAVFSHCFTCTKDLKAIVRISRGLARQGIAVLRFDFTGLGDSGGNFSETNFETNLADIRAAVEWLQQEHAAPRLLLGLSLGGAAMMSIANQIESVRGLVTLAAPSCTKHLAKFLSRQSPAIETEGEGQVTIGGRSYQMQRQLLESLLNRDLTTEIKAIRIPHLMFHSPQDETLGFYHAEEIFANSGGHKTFVTLDGANHLMANQADDVEFVADQIGLWASRWLKQ